MSIETGITFTVYADVNYHYEITADDELSLTYIELNVGNNVELNFGSADEMEAVALAMLNVVKLARDKKNA